MIRGEGKAAIVRAPVSGGGTRWLLEKTEETPYPDRGPTVGTPIPSRKSAAIPGTYGGGDRI